jgi:hypothetical protein
MDMGTARAFHVWPVQRPDWGKTVIAATAGRAKYHRWLDLRESWDLPITDMRSRVSERLADPETECRFESMKKSRGIPFAKIGMRVIGEGHEGVITGANCSANLNVLNAAGVTMNIHPTYDVQYFAGDGSLIAHIRRGSLVGGLREHELPPELQPEGEQAPRRRIADAPAADGYVLEQ